MSDPTAGALASARKIRGSVEANADAIQSMRRYLHAHPEPSGQEFKTSTYLSDQLSGLGVQHRLGPDGRGVIADSGPDDGSPVIALRADIDALRMQDEKTVSYRSREHNLMHACGHDAHTAMAMGAVRTLHELSELWPQGVRWRVIFQPAEETASGAKEMIECAALKDVRSILALHVEPTIPAGQVGWRVGPLTAVCEEFELLVTGRGGHGARPHTTLDPIASATQLVQAIYAQVPRSLNAQEPLVVSFGVIQGGINPNVIPESVQLRGTIRSFDPELSRAAKRRIREIADGIAQSNSVKIDFSVAYSLPGVMNDPQVTGTVLTAAEDIIGKENLIEVARPSLGGEDFAWYLDHVPGCMLRLGVGTPMRPMRHLHSTHFDIDERALPIGAMVLANGALSLALSLQP